MVLLAVNDQVEIHGVRPLKRPGAKVGAIWKRYEERAINLKKAGESDARLEDFRWRIEELRVSFWAQALKTPYPVSYKRLDKLWAEISKT